MKGLEDLSVQLFSVAADRSGEMKSMPAHAGRKEVEMAGENRGKITQVVGAVLDIRFDEGKLPEINEAIRISTRDGGELTVEVSQHLGDDTVRCIAMGSTDGLVRGMDAIATGAPISVPVGEKTLGRIFNVLGQIGRAHV